MATDTTPSTTRLDGNKRKGFASLSDARRREIASRGGKAAHRKGTAHEWTKEEAQRAGQKGGTVSRGGRGRLRPIDASPDPRL
jgi:uncharacterized protein